ncbi:uncharacterized protein LOC119069474 [Bradysia coprophila]|uniref:uncharacterized protein LOC119069474 n=1 Tax=Bradysia coprophila TaxID=38358 RepID=UPI00187DC433|nr:uncharacterized protein LOC119069474 [Bradysia coprophila]
MKVISAIAFAIFIIGVQPHGHIVDPPARNWIWTDPRFPDQPPNFNSQGVWCGDVECWECPPAFYIPQDEAFSRCGMCGDDINRPTPRDHEHGGLFGNGHIGRTYSAGSVIQMHLVFGAMHCGYFEVDLCADAVETPSCFQRLQILGGTERVRYDNRMCAPHFGGETRNITASIQLPANVRCNRCTLRWTYRTNYACFPNFPGDSACGVDPNPAQTFRNCADIAIV